MEVTNNYEFWRSIILANRKIHKARTKELMAMRSNISSKQFGILYFIKQVNHSPTAAEIARYNNQEEQTVLVMLRKLVQLGVIKKTRDKHRRNIYRIQMTPKGLQEYQSACEMQSLDTIFSVLSSEEKNQLVSSMGRLQKKALEVLHTYNEFDLSLALTDTISVDKSEILQR